MLILFVKNWDTEEPHNCIFFRLIKTVKRTEKDIIYGKGNNVDWTKVEKIIWTNIDSGEKGRQIFY